MNRDDCVLPANLTSVKFMNLTQTATILKLILILSNCLDNCVLITSEVVNWTFLAPLSTLLLCCEQDSRKVSSIRVNY